MRILFNVLLLLTAASSVRAQSNLFNSSDKLSVSETYLSALADFDLDGDLDIVSTSTTSGRVVVHFRETSGSYGSPSSYAVSGSWVYSVKVADFNKDGYPDLSLTGYNGSIQPCMSIMLNNGIGGFGSAQTYVTGQGLAFYHAVGDLNKDGNLDIVTANYYSNNITIFPGTGSGTFSTPTTIKALYAFDVVINDFNGDGNPDLVVTSPDNNQFLYFRGNGTATSFGAISYINTGSRPGNISSADFNGDGYPDIAMGSGGTSSVFVHLSATSSFSTVTTLSKSSSGTGVLTADLNADGFPDIISSNEFSSSLSFFPGNGNGTFGTAENYSVFQGPYNIVSGDLRGDGRQSIAVSCYSSNRVSLLFNTGPSPSYTIQAGSSSFGTISPSGSVSVNRDSSKTFTFIPDTGAQLDSVFVDGSYVQVGGNSYTFQQVRANHSIYAKFKSNQNFALQFDGNDDRVTTQSVLLNGTQDFSISAWINVPNPQKANCIAGNYNYPSSGSNGIEFYIYQGRLVGYLQGYIWGTSSIAANTWYHVAITRASGVVRLYVNGVLDATQTLSASMNATAKFTLGNFYSSNQEQFLGRMDEIVVYGRALTETEIKQTRDLQHSSVSTNSRLLYFPFGEGAGTNTSDLSGNGVNGTLVNGPQWVQSGIPTGPASNPTIALSSNQIDFGFVASGLSFTRTIKTFNTGNDSLRISAIQSNSQYFTVDSFSTVIAPGDSGTVHVRFTPDSPTSYQGQLSVGSNASNGTVSVALDGGGFLGPIVLDSNQNLGNFPVYAASFFNRYSGCVAGAGGRIFATVNGGRSWRTVQVGVNNDLYNIRLIGNAAFIGGSNGLLCVSYNGGSSWTPFNTNTSANFYGLSFLNASYGFAVGSAGTICLYRNGQWYPFSLNTTATFYSVYAIGNTAYAAGTGGTICRYNGSGWIPVNPGVSIDFYDVAFWDENFGLVSGANGTICRTYNGGQTWTALNTGSNSSVRSIRWIRRGTWIGFCDDGSILITQNEGNSWTRCYLGNYTFLSAEIYGCLALITTSEGNVLSFTLSGCTDEINPFYRRYYCGTTFGLRAVHFSSRSNGYAAGYGGSVFRTSNGGRNWVSSPTGISNKINCLRRGGSDLFIAGTGGLICKSGDNGQSWSPFTLGTTEDFNAISFAGSSRGWAVGTRGTICFYNGSGWSPQNVSSSITFYGVYAIGQTAYAVGANGIVCRYVGGRWIPVNPGVSNDFYACAFINETTGYIVGSGGIVCKTYDGGKTWKPLDCGSKQDLRCVEVACSGQAIIGGDSGTVVVTDNGGATWTSYPLGLPISLEDVDWLDSIAFLSGSNGEIYSFQLEARADTAIIYTPDGTAFCPGDSLRLVRGNGGSSIWSNGKNADTIVVHEPNVYSLFAGEGVCADTAVVTVTKHNNPVASAGRDTVLYLGYGDTCTTLKGLASGGQSPYTFIWGSDTSQNVTRCSGRTETYTLEVVDQNGCFDTDDVTVRVEDIRCGKKNDKKVLVGQNTKNNPHTICVSVNAVPAHLRKGDYLGTCASSNKMDEERGDFAIYPNPANQRIYVSTPSGTGESIRITISDLSGKVLINLVVDTHLDTAEEFEIDLTDVPTGLYFCHLRSNMLDRVYKFAVNRL